MSSPKLQRQTTITILGTNEEKKFAVATAIINDSNALLGKIKNYTKPTSFEYPSSATPKESILFVYVPSCTKKEKGGGISIKHVGKYLHKKVKFVNSFVLVLHGNELEAKNYNLVLAFVKMYGAVFLRNLIVVVTGSASTAAVSFSSLPTTTSAEYVQAWLDGLYPLLPPTSSPSSPFVFPFLFMHLNEDDNAEAFGQGREIFLLIRDSPAMGCLEPSEKSAEKYQKASKEKGLHHCNKCSRFFIPRLQQVLASADGPQSQVAMALERATSAAHLALTALKLDSVDKMVIEAEGVIVGGMEIVKEAVSAGAVERAQQALGTEAAKLGARVGAFAGGFVGTLALPGAGTTVGRFIGGNVGSRSAKFVLDACLDKVLGQNICAPCHKLKKAAKEAKKEKKDKDKDGKGSKT